MVASSVLIALAIASALQVPSPGVAVLAREDAGRGDAALARKDWVQAIESFSRAQRFDEFAPPVLLGLGRAHAGGGHDLAAIAWLRCYMAVAAAADAPRAQVPDDIVHLQVVAETRIRRIVQEGSDALQEIGEGDPQRAALVRQVAITSAIVNGDLATARATVLRAGADAAERDRMWADAASALAADDDLRHAIEAAQNIVDVAKRDELTRSLRERQAKAVQMPAAEQWISLARRLSEQMEVVNLDAALADVVRATPAEVPIQLLTIGSKLRAAYGRIQQLAIESRR